MKRKASSTLFSCPLWLGGISTKVACPNKSMRDPQMTGLRSGGGSSTAKTGPHVK